MIFQAIVTKYIGPSNFRGSRIKAQAAAGSITLHYDSALNSETNHARAAQALANKFKWKGAWFGGGMPNDKGNVYVCANPALRLNEFVPEFVTEGEG